MQNLRDLTPLIQTKLHRPPLPVDLVPRPRLIEWLNQHQRRPLTLVSAPAGYGKSTLISCWLESVDCPNAWVSLDEHDNELMSFLLYFLAAFQKIFPNAGTETQSLLMATPLPPIHVVSRVLLNELNQIEQPFILVLDDYQLIETQSIHDLLNEILLHPPHNLHLVLGTRMDPLLPLVTLRAKSQVTEVRTQDLRFSFEETTLLFQKMVGAPLDQTTLMNMDALVEGWVTGLRLAALAMHHRIGRPSIAVELSAHNRYVTDYLFTEILAKQAARLSDCMVKTSILERFCAGLCETVCFQEKQLPKNGANPSESSGVQFLRWLQASNLFVIPLDDQREWFRYHHLFRDFLQQELVRRFTPDEIKTLHSVTGRWYACNGWNEEALYHLLLAEDISAAIELVARHRPMMMNSTQWSRLEGWLNLFSAGTVEASSELWMLKTWLFYHRGQWSELPALLHQLDTIMTQQPDQEKTRHLIGEISSLRSLIAYHSGDIDGAISHARRALDFVDPEFWIVRVFARMHLGGGLLLKGDVNGACHAFYGAFEEEKVQSKPFKATLLMTTCYIHWVTADLQSMEQAANQAITLCQETDFLPILGQSSYHLGCVRYQHNDLVAAEGLFKSVVDRPYQNYGTGFSSSVCGLALTYQAMGRAIDASDVTERAIAFLLESGNTTQMPVIQALQAELALMQGRVPVASQWAAKLDPVPSLVPMPWFLAPHLTLVKVWLAKNTPASQAKAAGLLIQLQEYLDGIHNTRFLIETLALQALFDDATGNQPAALISLEKALRLAQPGGFIRLFVDLGAQMAVLLSRMVVDQELKPYLTQIRSAFQGSQKMEASIIWDEIPETLTDRELQILELLGERLSNKEIAAQLVITPGTVKGHTIHIYQKLNVNSRRQAVDKAIKLGILTPG